jgi:hypothetical protein
MNFKVFSALAVGLLSAAPVFSTPVPVTLDFEGASSFASINGFYNGGADSAGASGTNAGVSFGGDALALSNDALGPYYSHAPTPGTIMAPVGADAALNSSFEFSGVASFYYSSIENISVSIFSDLNGLGTLLGTFSLLANAQSGCADTPFCHWDLASLNIEGVAQSIQFGSAANVAGFDNVTITSVPEPSTAWLMLLSLIGTGIMIRRKKIG